MNKHKIYQKVFLHRPFQMLLVLAFALIFSVASFFVGVFFPEENQTVYYQKIQNFIQAGEKQVSKNLHHIWVSLNPEVKQPGVFENLLNLSFVNENLAIYCIYRNDSIFWWSSNKIDIPVLYRNDFESDMVLYKNTWLRVLKLSKPPFTIIGLIPVYTTYHIDNKYLKSGFVNIDYIPAQARLFQVDNSDLQGIILSSTGKPLFRVEFALNHSNASRTDDIQAILCLLALICFIIGIHMVVCSSKKSHWIRVTSGAMLLLFIRAIMLMFRIPSSFYHTEWFNPQIFASSAVNPSLADLALNSFFIFLIMYWIYRLFQVPELKPCKTVVYAIALFFSVLMYIAVTVVHYISVNLVVNSNIPFEAYKILELSKLTLVSYAVLFILLVTLYFICDILIRWLASLISFQEFLKINSFTGIVIIISGLYFHKFHFLFSVTWFWVLLFVMGFLRFNSRISFSWIIILVLAGSVYSVLLVHLATLSRERNNMKTKAISLAYEHDPIAELQFSDIDARLTADTTLKQLICAEKVNYEVLYYYLRDNYFSGYFNRYDLQVTFCNPNDSVYISEPDNRLEYCFGFFNRIVSQFGQPLQGNGFYYINYQQGIISYFRELDYIAHNNQMRRLYIELDSKLVNELLGYPELLLDAKTSQKANNIKYPYAKYKDNQLIAKYGDYQYSTIQSIFSQPASDFLFKKANGYEHLFYRFDERTVIIISRQSATWFDITISLTYIFIFYLSSVFIVLTVFFSKTNIIRFKSSFKSRIQLALILILLVTFILMGFVNLLFTREQYNEQQKKMISEKMQSVLIELQAKLGNRDNLMEIPGEYLNNLLVKFSNVFYTDINLYQPNGKLLAGSRQTIYDYQLCGRLMNPLAYQKMICEGQPIYIQTENIGLLSYSSAYMPFINHNNKIIAYINLPYFSRETDFKNRLKIYIATIINIYVLLIFITVFIALIIAGKLTYPLKLIQQKMRQLNLMKKGEPIDYKSFDEIGSLIKAYNAMLEELEQSAKKLALTERELAWREMAMQIAHEIRNPLTPMKLKIQMLEKMWHSNHPEFAEKFPKTTQMLIEQIDTLSVIASEFGDFARIRQAKPEKVDIVEQIYSTVSLYADLPEINQLIVDCPFQQIFIMADAEQVKQVFNNLLKNAVQAVPTGKKAVIKIIVKLVQNNVEIDILDNGTGISPETAEKLFKPNFTTKTGGMGLGLSIVKTIVEHFNGSVTYKTSPNGSVFTVVFPVVDQLIQKSAHEQI